MRPSVGISSGSLFRVGESISISNVLIYVSLLVVFIVVLEQLLHKLEHYVKHSRKHDEMLRKVYRELMILGFLGVAIKIYKEITHVSAYSNAIIAFQCADLTIFILAIALILQASCVFLALRHENYELEEAELMRSSDLAAAYAQQEQGRYGWYPAWWWGFLCHSNNTPTADVRELVELRVLRHLFQRRYGLPELFPFSKYVRQAQDNQITHMIDVEMSMWLLLLGVAWAMDGVIVLLQQVPAFQHESHAIVLALFIFAWSLVGLHALVAVYFRNCVCQLLHVEGLTHERDTIPCLTTIGENEDAALRDEMAKDALVAMQIVQERQDAKYREAKRKHRRAHHHLIERDTGFQLLITFLRHVLAWLWRSNGDEDKPRESRADTELTSTTSTPITLNDLVPHATRRRSAELRVHIRWFSRKAWQFAVMVIMMLNGLYLALLCQCVFYQFGLLSTYSSPFRVVITVGLPLPVLLNMFLFQPPILRNFMIVSSILQVDVATLSKVVTHFSEIVELRAEFARTLVTCLQESRVSRADFQRSLEAKDRDQSGRLELDQLRLVLRSVGFRLSFFRFNSVAKLLFELNGATVEYAQVLRLIALAQQNADELPGMVDELPVVHPGHVLLRQSILLEELITESSPVGDSPHFQELSESARQFESVKTGHTHDLLSRVSETTELEVPSNSLECMNDTSMQQRRRSMARRRSSFQNTSARTLHSLYHLHSTSFVEENNYNSAIDVPDSPTAASVYIAF